MNFKKDDGYLEYLRAMEACKRGIRDWQRAFKREHGRLPKGSDVRKSAPRDVLALYERLRELTKRKTQPQKNLTKQPNSFELQAPVPVLSGVADRPMAPSDLDVDRSYQKASNPRMSDNAAQRPTRPARAEDLSLTSDPPQQLELSKSTDSRPTSSSAWVTRASSSTARPKVSCGEADSDRVADDDSSCYSGVDLEYLRYKIDRRRSQEARKSRGSTGSSVTMSRPLKHKVSSKATTKIKAKVKVKTVASVVPDESTLSVVSHPSHTNSKLKAVRGPKSGYLHSSKLQFSAASSARGSLRHQSCQLHPLLGPPTKTSDISWHDNVKDTETISEKIAIGSESSSLEVSETKMPISHGSNSRTTKSDLKALPPGYRLKHPLQALNAKSMTESNGMSTKESAKLSRSERQAKLRASQVSTNFVRTELRHKRKSFRKKGGWGKNRAKRERRAAYNAQTARLYGDTNLRTGEGASSEINSNVKRSGSRDLSSGRVVTNSMDVIDRILDAELGIDNKKPETHLQDRQKPPSLSESQNTFVANVISAEEGLSNGKIHGDIENSKSSCFAKEQERGDLLAGKDAIQRKRKRAQEGGGLLSKKSLLANNGTLAHHHGNDLSISSKTVLRCSGHQLPAKIWSVKKSGPNKGRKFWSCPLERNDRCDFFCWADNSSSAAVAAYFENGKDRQEGDLSAQTYDRMESYIRRWSTMTVAELKVILKRKKLAVSGKKEVLLERLKDAFKAQGDLVDRALGLQSFQQMGSSSNNVTSKLGGPNHSYETTSSVDSEIGSDSDGLQLISDSESDEGRLLQKSSEHDKDAKSDVSDHVHNIPLKMAKAERVLRQVFGFEWFRPAQKWAIERVLDGKSTLVIAPTGSGKSLIYQIPSFLLPGLTLVVSPLLSLIQDQLDSLPAALPGAALTSNQTASDTGHVLRDLRDRRVKVLFVSPERLFSASFQRLIHTPGALPEISLAVIDEAHCISQWSHNFRPSYLRLHSALSASSGGGVGARCVVALTATATKRTVNDVCSVLHLDRKLSVWSGTWKRDNLKMAVVSTRDRHNTLERILDLPFFRKQLGGKKRQKVKNGKVYLNEKRHKTHSIIVYVFRRSDAENLADYLVGRGYSAKAYHAGMSSVDRRRVQSSFMAGTTSIAVATVAFGMGLDKSDVRGVIHFHMPRSPEHYVQEVGRAGRDGRDAWCYLLVTPDSSDFFDAHSLAHSDAVDECQVRRLLGLMVAKAKTLGVGRIFENNDALAENISVPRPTAIRVEHVNVDVNVSLEVDKLMKQLDLDEATIETIMCRMALRNWYKKEWIDEDSTNSSDENMCSPMYGLPILDMRPRANVVCIVTFLKSSPSKVSSEDISGVIKEIISRGVELSNADRLRLSGLSAKDVREQEKHREKLMYSKKYSRYVAGDGYAKKESKSFVFNLDKLLSEIAMSNKEKGTMPSINERAVRRTLDRYRARGEITTTWRGSSLRAHMHLLPSSLCSHSERSLSNESSSKPDETSSDRFSDINTCKAKKDQASATVDQVSKDLWEIANTLTKKSVSKVEGMFRAASRAAVSILPSGARVPASAKKDGHATECMYSANLEMSEDGALHKSAEILELGLSRYFQDQDGCEDVFEDGAIKAAAIREEKDSAYENARLKRIIENKMELVRLGLMKMSDYEREYKEMLDNSNSSHVDSAKKEVKDNHRAQLAKVELPFRSIDDQARALLRSDIRILLQNNLLSANKLTSPRVITRIMHGLGSPAFPAPDFWNCVFWKRHRNYRFDELLDFVTSEMFALKVHHGTL